MVSPPPGRDPNEVQIRDVRRPEALLKGESADAQVIQRLGNALSIRHWENLGLLGLNLRLEKVWACEYRNSKRSDRQLQIEGGVVGRSHSLGWQIEGKGQ